LIDIHVIGKLNNLIACLICLQELPGELNSAQSNISSLVEVRHCGSYGAELAPAQEFMDLTAISKTTGYTVE
jgi:hypothetical protein